MTFPKWMTERFAKPQQDILTGGWRWLMGGFPFAEPISSACGTAFGLRPWGDAWLPGGKHGHLRCTLLTRVCCSAGVSLPQTIAIMFIDLNLRVVQRAWLPQLSVLTCVQPVFFTLGILLCSLKPLSEKHVFISLCIVSFKYFSMKMSHWGWVHHS